MVVVRVAVDSTPSLSLLQLAENLCTSSFHFISWFNPYIHVFTLIRWDVVWRSLASIRASFGRSKEGEEEEQTSKVRHWPRWPHSFVLTHAAAEYISLPLCPL